MTNSLGLGAKESVFRSYLSLCEKLEQAYLPVFRYVMPVKTTFKLSFYQSLKYNKSMRFLGSIYVQGRVVVQYERPVWAVRICVFVALLSNTFPLSSVGIIAP
jgi:hypothetical protein